MIKSSKDLTAADAATINFFNAVATDSKLSIRLGGENLRKHLPEAMYYMLTGPSEEVVQANLGAYAVLVTQLFFGQDKDPKNYEVACSFIKLLRELKPKVEAGEMTPAAALHSAYSRRKGEEVKEKAMKVSAEEAEILRMLRSGELKF